MNKNKNKNKNKNTKKNRKKTLLSAITSLLSAAMQTDSVFVCVLTGIEVSAALHYEGRSTSSPAT